MTDAEDPTGKSRHIRPTKDELASWSRSINLAKFPEDGISFDDTKRLITEAYDGRRARNIVSEMLAVLKENQYEGVGVDANHNRTIDVCSECWSRPHEPDCKLAAVIAKAEELVG